MRAFQITLLGVAIYVTVACAYASQAPVETASFAQAGGSSLDRTRHQQSRSQAEVARLKRDVSRQQTDSEQASQRLQQQDEAIADLQKQLHDLRIKQPAVQR